MKPTKTPPRGTNSPLKNEKGVALLTALFAVLLIWYIVIEVTYDASVEFNVNASRVNEVRSYYAAKSGLEIGLLRVLIYRKIMAEYGSLLKDNPQYAQMIEPLWKLPFAWPPVLPEEMVRVDKELINDAVKESLFDAQYLVTIEDEGSKIDLNDLGSEALRDTVRSQLTNIFESKMKGDPEWASKYSGFDFQEIINNIQDWVDADTTSLQGGAEQAKYQKIDDEILPPNRNFRTVDEVKLVAEMTPEIFALLEPRITVYGMKAINPNYAPEEVLMALSPNMTKEIVTQIRERISDPNQGPFTGAEEFEQFLQALNIQLATDLGPNKDQKIPLVFDRLYNFRVQAEGIAGRSMHRITAIAYDLDHVAEELAKLQKKPENAENDQRTEEDRTKPETRASDQAQNKPPTGRPRIVYWSEN